MSTWLYTLYYTVTMHNQCLGSVGKHCIYIWDTIDVDNRLHIHKLLNGICICEWDSTFSLSINKGNHHGIMYMEIWLNHTVNKTNIEFNYYIQKDTCSDKLMTSWNVNFSLRL